MKEQDIIDLGFTKEFGDNFHYYTYDFVRGLSLITRANDEVVNNEWVVEFFNLNTICFTNKESVEKLIKIINKAKI